MDGFAKIKLKKNNKITFSKTTKEVRLKYQSKKELLLLKTDIYESPSTKRLSKEMKFTEHQKNKI